MMAPPLVFFLGVVFMSINGDELSSSVGLYFRIFAHFGSRVTLTVTLLSSQCYYCPAEVILLFGRGHFIIRPRSFYCSQLLILILLFFCFFVFCHTVARITADVTAEAIVTFVELCEISPFSLFHVAFFFFFFSYFWLFVNFTFTFL